MSDNYQDYLEGKYDKGNRVREYIQIKADEDKAKRVVEEVKEKQEEAKRQETERILDKKEVTEDEINQVFDDYGMETDKYAEYIVDGATLTCNKVFLRSYPLAEEKNGWQKIVEFDPELYESTEQLDKRKETTLNVSENPIYDNGLTYATVSDTVKNKNIRPFRCNCQIGPPDRAYEFENILNDPKACEHGVCRHLMRLNAEWENLPLPQTPDTPPGKTGYMRLGEISGTRAESIDSTYLQGVRSGDIEDVTLVSEKDGITMTSILFCKHGGIITPVKSGQKDIGIYTKEKAIEILDRYLQGENIEELVEAALECLARHSTYQLPTYSSNHNYDYDRYDTYILGWTEYYIDYYEKKYGAENIYIVDPAYIKSQCYQESRVGTDNTPTVPTTNPQRDIMQVLDVKNYNLYDYIDISCNQFWAATSQTDEHGKTVYWLGTDIWGANHKDKKEDGTLKEPPPDGSKYSKEKMERCGGLISTLFTTNKDGTGNVYVEGSNDEYYYQHEYVTPVMSLAVGMDKMWEELQKSHGNYKEALMAYNGSSKKEEYAKDIIDRVENPGLLSNLE